jgi:hypothetical protein
LHSICKHYGQLFKQVAKKKGQLFMQWIFVNLKNKEI